MHPHQFEKSRPCRKQKIRPGRKQRTTPGRKQKIMSGRELKTRPNTFKIFPNVFNIPFNIFANPSLISPIYVPISIPGVTKPPLRLSTRLRVTETGVLLSVTRKGRLWERFGNRKENPGLGPP